MKKKIHKILAVYLAINILFEIIAPTVAMALTTGPSQPEFQSFEPVGTTEMVDPFSGDFNYNIPLMTVPGPNGGYPINLAYHAGIGMEEEASWVGLGWNLNVGEINRQMRGLPDDFNGDLVTQEMYSAPNITAALTGKVSTEIVGLDLGLTLNTSLQLAWNSYQGVGIAVGQGMNVKKSGETNSYTAGLNTSYSSLTGTTDLSASLSYSGMLFNRFNSFGLAYSRNSLEGIKSLSFAPPTIMGVAASLGIGASFSGSSFIPHADMPMGGFSIASGFEAGPDIWMVNLHSGIEASYTQNKISKNSIAFKGYGYLYSQSRDPLSSSQAYSLMDVNREKDVHLTKDIPALAMPMHTNDIYVVNGQGIGGAFRPYRSDIGVLSDPVITSRNVGAGLTTEIASGTTTKLGTDIVLSYSKGYSGPWRDANMWSEFDTEYRFKDKDLSTPLYEPYYFKNVSDLTANFDEESGRLVTPETELPIEMAFGLSVNDIANPTLATIEQPLADARVKMDGRITYNKLANRQSRSQMMSLKTRTQLSTTSSSSDFGKKAIYTLGDFPRTQASPSNISYSSYGDHTGEITVVNPDGNRYVYGLPAYNNQTKEVSFSVTKGHSENAVSENDRIIDYSTTDASSGNAKNEDHFYTFKKLPPYAHSYLLTAVVSPDYVDLTGDGLTADDYGYYTKFNYSKLSGNDYKWRSPFRKASFVDGYYSITKDDKAGYVYGEKEIWYLNSIETKTHVAEFHLSDRTDGRGAADERNASGFTGSGTLKKLDKIDLYSKSDPSYSGGTPVPIKTVNFTYTYDLCGNTINNANYSSSVGPADQPPANSGKLTLTKVSFSFLGNLKSSLSPYEFDYHEKTGATINLTENPNYSTMQMDRWGNYKNDSRYSGQNGYNQEDPYTIQRADFDNNGTIATADTDARNYQVSAWSLRKITLPSGGEIKVDYESDDYGYVQDQGAMQMAKIVAVGTSNAPSDLTGRIITNKDLFVYFELKDQSQSSQSDIYPYVKGIKDIYFKTYQKLKKEYGGSNMKSDFVSGYAKVGGSNADGTFTTGDAGTNYGYFTYSGKRYGYLKLAKINVHDNNFLAGLDYTNPIRKAGWQYLKLNRPDLLSPQNNLSTNPTTAALLQLAAGAIGYFKSNVQLLIGYYKYCITAGYCKEVDITDTYPSFIRVNSPDKIKFGGGHRVKRLIETDSWTGDATVNEYGQEYIYRNTDGTSSGIADYEPLIGGEEIPLRQPIRYSSDYFIVKHKDLYMEYPFCESYYPGASVGYSRVIVKGITHQDNQGTPADVTKGIDGTTLYEFYTSRDFPLTVKASGLSHKKFTPDLSIPFIGNVSFENHAMSQSFTVERNDMHGKLRAVSTYPGGVDLTSGATKHNPVSKTEFIYKTDAPFSPGSKNQLSNLVDVLFDDAYYKQANLGLTKEYFMDMRERSTVSMSNGGQLNVEISFPPPALALTYIPGINYSEMLNKTVVSMNIINRNGILTETKQFEEGSMVSTKNLMFDATTGEPLLTTVTNNFDAPVYNYDYAAHWAYDGMGAAYKNTGAAFTITQASSVCTLSVAADPRNYLVLGDQVSLSTDATNPYWVTSITPTGFVLTKRDNTAYSGATATMTIMRSGRRNLQDVSDGKIVSLGNPITTRRFSLFDDGYVTGMGSGAYQFTDCAGTQYGVSTVASGGDTKLTISASGGSIGCIAEVLFPTALSGTYTFKKWGPHKVLATPSGEGAAIEGTWTQIGDCFKECLDGVLHADATEFKNDWSLEIDTVIQDIYNNQSAGPSFFDNFYASGKQGIWRTKRTNLYQVDRKRSSAAVTPYGVLDDPYTSQTNIAKDGTYDKFVLFDWNDVATNPKWTWTSQVSKINPWGFEIENKDRLGIFSTAMYGYNNSLQTAIASNAQYYEIAYDGFEDYASSPYASHGHFNLTGTTTLSTIQAHTGKKSLFLDDAESASFTTATSVGTSGINYFVPIASKKYVVSAWYKSNGMPLTIGISGASGTPPATTYSYAVEGWIKAERTFEATSGPAAITISFVGGTNAGTVKTYVDDIRIQPFESAMKTYVYDPDKLWLTAELDNQNFATFYNYDEEGTMFQVKKETAKGVATVKTTRSNIKRQ